MWGKIGLGLSAHTCLENFVSFNMFKLDHELNDGKINIENITTLFWVSDIAKQNK